MYIVHFQIRLDYLLSGGPIVHDEEGKMKCLFGIDGSTLFDGYS